MNQMRRLGRWLSLEFNEFWQKGLATIQKEDKEAQEGYLRLIAEKVRDIPYEALEKTGAFFVPNEGYVRERFGPMAFNPEFNLYEEQHCVWLHFLVFPVTDAAGEVHGLAGFQPFLYLKAKETGDWSISYYAYSSKVLFDKGKFLFCLDGTYRRALREGYLVVTDGLFDTLSLTHSGFCAAALLGSVLTPEILMQLRLIRKVILAIDNDEAGIKLYKQMCRYLRNVVFIKQPKVKDADDILKSEFRERYVEALSRMTKDSMFLNEVVTFSNPHHQKGVLLTGSG